MASTCLHTGKARPSTQTREWAAGRRQETGCADSGLELEPRGWLGGCRGRKRTGTPPFHRHTPPGPTPGHVLPCLVRSRCLRSPAPAGTSGAPARRPPPALRSRCRLSRCRSGRRLRLGRGNAGGGAAAERVGPTRELSAAGSAAGGDSTARRSAWARSLKARPEPGQPSELRGLQPSAEKR